MKNLLVLLAGVLLLAGCNTSYEKTTSGVRYKIIKGKGGENLKVGDIIKFNQVALIPERDTTLFTTYGKIAAYVRIDSGAAVQYTLMEILPKMKTGDSAVVVLSVDSLKNKGMIRDYDNAFRRGGQITFRLRVLKRFANEDAANKEYQADMAVENTRLQKESEKSAQTEIKELNDYLAKNKIQTVKTPSGAFVEIQQKGTGSGKEPGMMADVFYTGKLLKDGTAFDSNIDPKFQHTDPLQVQLGTGGMIKGFEEGLMEFGKGGKGRIFIPSNLAYGPQGAPPRIPANATLVFEVEVRDLKPVATVQQPTPDTHGGH